ncbi:hypothetical protein CIK05_05605 [Bdellovibrio sp. qaytius]|nr:hypothetical protein CIK05_05605 [Bdellovibrio sp. qaytius]
MNLTNFVQYIAPLIGLITLAIGVAAMLKPEPMSKKFGVAVSGSALPYVISTGMRDIFMGLVVLLLFYRQETATLGVCMFFLSAVALSDFWIVFKHGDRKTSFVHLSAAVAAAGYGLWI